MPAFHNLPHGFFLKLQGIAFIEIKGESFRKKASMKRRDKEKEREQ